MTDEQLNRKLTAILSADAKGYSRLMGEDEVTTIQTLKNSHEIMTTEIQRYHGRVIDSPGDNLLAEFASIVDAVNCALNIQERLKRFAAHLPEDQKMPFRIGINLGDVVVDGEGIYGDGVNIAARLEGLAEAGGICISGSAYDQVQNKLAFGGEYLGEQQVKNIEVPLKVYKIWPDPKADGRIEAKRKTAGTRRFRSIAAALVLILAGAAAFYAWQGDQKQRPFKDASPLPQQLATSFSDKPSIAVLPFNNLSDDKEQEYFSDGITNDIITDLSKFRELAVTASNTVFKYKGKAIELNPNDYRTYRRLAPVLLYSGKLDEALYWYETSMKYDHSHASSGTFMNLGIANFLKGDIDKALYWLNRSVAKWPTFLGNHIVLAAVHGHTGNLEEAHKEARNVLSIAPFFEVDFYGEAFYNPDHRNKMVEGLRKAGLE